MILNLPKSPLNSKHGAIFISQNSTRLPTHGFRRQRHDENKNTRRGKGSTITASRCCSNFPKMLALQLGGYLALPASRAKVNSTAKTARLVANWTKQVVVVTTSAPRFTNC